MAEPVLIDLKLSEPSKALLDLNNAHAQELSFLTPEKFRTLIGEAFMACRVGEAQALLLAFSEKAAYDSPNYLWFQARLPRFVYVDRVVVDPGSRGRGLARCLYEALFVKATQSGHQQVVCEVNVDPPNPASDAFHENLGFQVIGSALLPDGKKRVRYFSRPLTA